MKSKLQHIVRFPNLLQDKKGYWQYLTPDFEDYLHKYLVVFEQYRKLTNALPPTEEDWRQLPFGPFAKNPHWKWRRQSLAVLEGFTKNKSLDCILEIGPWNGWMTKYLAPKAKTVIGADYFVDPFDGIGNIQSFSENIVAVQCNVNTVHQDFKPNSLDLIVLNHCLPYTENPVGFIKNLIPLLTNKGKIIALGNTFYKDSSSQTLRVQQQGEPFFEKYNRNLYIHPVKGYLDQSDKKELTGSGFKIKAYPGKWLQNLYSVYNPKAPSYNYIVYDNKPVK
jgi:hypothetical protein